MKMREISDEQRCQWREDELWHNGIYIRPYNCELPIPEGEHINTHCLYMHGQLDDDLNEDRTAYFYNINPYYTESEIRWTSIHGDVITELHSEVMNKIASCKYGYEFREASMKKVMRLCGGYSVTIQGIDKPCIGLFKLNIRRVSLSEELKKEILTINPLAEKWVENKFSIFESKGLVCYQDNSEDMLYVIKNFNL